MKLLFDQNISYRIIEKISNLFPGSLQEKQAGLQDSKNSDIWDYTKKNDFSIVIFNSDFNDLSMIKESPPKIIWLRTGNTSTENIFQVIKENQELITKFLKDIDLKDVSCLEID